MNIIGTFISVGILWFLITLFTRSTNSTHTLNETWIVVIGMLFVKFLSDGLRSNCLALSAPPIQKQQLNLYIQAEYKSKDMKQKQKGKIV